MNPPPIQWLPVFYYAAQYKSFRKAAERLCVSPPAVSQHIKSLEAYLGVRLFKRNGPTLTLTDEGKFYYQSIQPMMMHYHSSFNEFDRRFNKRVLRLNTPLFIAQELLIPNYMHFKVIEPNAELRISTGTEYIDFDSNIADAAIRFGHGDWPELNAKLLCKVAVSPICSTNYTSSHIDIQRTLEEQLNNQVILTTDESIKEWRQLFPNIAPKEVVVCDSYFSIIKSAEMGVGIALGIFPAVNNWINNQKLQRLTQQMFEIEAGYWFVYPKQRTDNTLIDAGYKWSSQLFGKLPKLG